MIIEKNNFNINNFEIKISDNGIAHLDSSWSNENVCDPYSRLYFVKSGSGFLRHNGTTYPLKGGNVYFVPAELTFSYGCDTLEKIFFHISITKTEKYDLFSDVKKITSLPFSEQEYESLKKLYWSTNYMDKLDLKKLIYGILSDFVCKHRFKRVEIKSYSEAVRKTLDYIHKNTKISLSVREISKQLFISESKIRKAFKSELGITVGEYIDDLVFIKAKKLLCKKNALIGEISDELGFCDQFYFSRRFKDKFNKTPSEYRKENPF